MNLIKKNYLDPDFFINSLIIFLPISFIVGNLAINLNVILIIFFSFLFYKKDIFKTKLFLFDKLLITIFAFSFLTAGINSFIYNSNIDTLNNINTYTLEKTFAFLRFLFFYFMLKFLIEKKIFNFKFFFLSASLFSIFVSIDLIYQLIIGKDIFGFPITSFKLSGPFGDEEIAGSYLQRFSIFSFFLITIYFSKLGSKNQFTIFFLLLSLFIYSIFLSGNRMPIIIFFLFWIFLFIFDEKLRKFIIPFLGATAVLVYLIISLNDQVNNYTLHFLRITLQIFEFLPELKSNESITQFPNTYIKEFYSGFNAWQENIFIGGGINSFHYNCIKTVNACASHPHNYYLEILSEHGLIGMLLWSYIFFYVIYVSIIKKYIFRSNYQNNDLITPFAILFLVEIFPVKTTGSFFTTGNATYIFFLIAVIIALSRKSQYN